MRIAGFLVVLASCSCTSSGSPAALTPASTGTPQAVLSRTSPSTAGSPVSREGERLDLDLVRRVDLAIQGRFAVVRPEDIRKGRLGASRVGGVEPSRHSRVFEPEADSEREMLARLYAAGWLGVVYVAGDGNFVGPITLGRQEPSRVGDRNALRTLAAACRTSGRAVQGSDGPVVLEARPVLASQALCLRCHADKAIGEPIGVVVYAFSRGRPWVATASGE